MISTRISTPEDVPAQRELWTLAFGDGGAYLDNFYENYYRPDRVMVLEEDGVVRAMTAWFDTDLFLASGGRVPAAYLYAVATHPDCRGRGFAARLLKDIGEHLKSKGFPLLTTVPAEPSLHNFFAGNGFEEGFVHEELTAPKAEGKPESLPALEKLDALGYGQLREDLLKGTSHIFYHLDSLFYQEGCCEVSGGGLYKISTPDGPVCFCAEGMEDGSLLIKELLGTNRAKIYAVKVLSAILPGFSGLYRVPGGNHPFGMLRWLDEEAKKACPALENAYLGLAFD